MSTWELERFPAGGGASTKQALASWSIQSATLTLRNWDADELVCNVRSGSDFLGSSAWGYLDKVVLWRDGVRVFHGWLTSPARQTQPESESMQLSFAGPWWWLVNTPYIDPVATSITYGMVDITTSYGTGKVVVATSSTFTTPFGSQTFTDFRDVSPFFSQGQIRRALWAAISGGAPIGIGTLGITGPAASQDDRNATCAARVQIAAQFSPLSVAWFDYSGTSPVFHCADRGDASEQTCALSAHTQAAGIAPMYERQAHAVRISYWYNREARRLIFTDSTLYGGDWFLEDKAGDDGWPAGPGAIVVAVDMDDAPAANLAVSYGVAAKIYAALSPLSWSGSLQLHETNTAPTLYRPGQALNITGGMPEWETMAALIQQTAVYISPESNDVVSVSLGAPDQLGVQDWLELSRLIREAGMAGGITVNGGIDPEPTDPVPGTLDDLNEVFTGTGVSGAIAVQTQGGTWAKVGFGQYTPDSGSVDPTKRYRTKQGSGSITTASSTLLCSDVWATTGASRYSATTGELVETMHVTIDGVDQGERLSGQWNGVVAPCCSGYHSAYSSSTLLAISEWAVVGDGSTGCTADGTHTVTLQNEDTEDDAFARTIAASPDWVASPNTAIRTVASSAATGLRRKLRVGTYAGIPLVYTPLTGMAHRQRYRIAIELEQRPVDESGGSTGDWTAAGTIYSEPWCTDANGAGGMPWQEIEASPGFELRIKSTDVQPY
jgi:hypothetical protein